MAFTVDHAKRMRAAYKKAGKRTVQIGHQCCSSGQVTDAAQFPGDRQCRQGHRDPRAHVPQYAAREAAVVAAGLSGHDAARTSSGNRFWARRRSMSSTPTGT